jgi:hypothetical protein
LIIITLYYHHHFSFRRFNFGDIFVQEFCNKYLKGELKLEAEAQAIQTIIAYGLEGEELRDEIFVQCMRHATNNPNMESTERVWLLLCLSIVAFQPTKLLFKVRIFPISVSPKFLPNRLFLQYFVCFLRNRTKARA